MCGFEFGPNDDVFYYGDFLAVTVWIRYKRTSGSYEVVERTRDEKTPTSHTRHEEC